jgi:hypothetical protein
MGCQPLRRRRLAGLRCAQAEKECLKAGREMPGHSGEKQFQIELPQKNDRRQIMYCGISANSRMTLPRMQVR